MSDLFDDLCWALLEGDGLPSQWSWLANDKLVEVARSSELLRKQILALAWARREQLPSELAVYVALAGGCG